MELFRFPYSFSANWKKNAMAACILPSLFLGILRVKSDAIVNDVNTYYLEIHNWYENAPFRAVVFGMYLRVNRYIKCTYGYVMDERK